MNRIERKVAAARRRLILARFGRTACITLFAALIVATIAIAVPAIVFVDVDYQSWVYGWVGGSTLTAVFAAAAVALLTAPTSAEVAAEVDRRFGLRERLSSSLTLPDSERETEFGAALLSDWLPLAVVPVLTVVLLLVDPATETVASSTKQTDPAEVKQVQTVAKQLKKQIQQQRRKAESDGLKEATELYEKMAAKLDEIMKREQLDRKEAMIAMNDLKKQLEQRRDELGSSQEMRKALAQMKGINAGPAEKIAKSIEKGDFNQAKDLVNDLAKKIRDGKLSEAEKQQLKKQIDQMKAALKKSAQQHEQKKRELQQKIEQARKEGRGNDAAKLQQEMNKLQQKDGQLQKMAEMAQAMGQAAQAMQEGNSGAAADALDQMSEGLGEMADELSELEDLQATLGDLAQSKEQMRCQQCQGAGCQGCQGGFGQGQGFGDGLGRGAGEGYRPESEDETNTYESQVRGKVKRGKAIIAGFADGPNRKGVSREDIKAAVESAISEEADPAENQTLPRTEREHTQQYFEQLRQR